VLWDEFPNPTPEAELRRAMAERVVVTHEHYYPPLQEWVENRIYPSPDGGLAIFQRYVTERKRAEEELRRSETTQAEGQRLTHTGSGVWNVATGEVVWSQEMYRIYGFEPGSMTPRRELFMHIVHPDDQLRVDQVFQRVVHEEIGYDMEFRIVRPNGQVRHLHSVGHPVYNEAGKLTEVIGTILDITERKQAEEERGKLLRRLMASQEEERVRIARQLHDQMGQNVSALHLKLATLEGTHRGQADLDEQIEILRAIARQLEHDVDFLVWELRPTALDDLGLLTALSNYVKNWSKRFGVRAELQDFGIEKDRLSGEIETVLYRATQEALTNIAKHAKASNVGILLELRSNHVSLIVEDDGVGFDAEQAFGAEQKGVGLLGMRERVSLVGGTVDIESTPGNGVTVAVRIPVPGDSDSGEQHE
jgi:PAS domain S-box-containing protein